MENLDLKCNLCKKSRNEVLLLIKGRLCLCKTCIGICASIIAEYQEKITTNKE